MTQDSPEMLAVAQRHRDQDAQVARRWCLQQTRTYLNCRARGLDHWAELAPPTLAQLMRLQKQMSRDPQDPAHHYGGDLERLIAQRIQDKLLAHQDCY